ncbi:hypothetical protein BT69DRAFT_1288945 [Atractiella rhizophila]|nr:hypothetical protein BT69DRAFT_1288945 [Atractiella rhizophila]
MALVLLGNIVLAPEGTEQRSNNNPGSPAASSRCVKGPPEPFQLGRDTRQRAMTAICRKAYTVASSPIAYLLALQLHQLHKGWLQLANALTKDQRQVLHDSTLSCPVL